MWLSRRQYQSAVVHTRTNRREGGRRRVPLARSLLGLEAFEVGHLSHLGHLAVLAQYNTYFDSELGGDACHLLVYTCTS